MTTPHLSVMHGSTSPAPADEAAAAHAAVQLQPAPSMVVHIHLGMAPATDRVTATPFVRRHSALTGLVALALLGGGYLAGSRRSEPPAEENPLAGLAAASTLLPSPALPSGEVPQAVRDMLARPPVISQPGGTAAGSSGGPRVTPARNPFGLGN